jgi:hypothetical protein
MPWLIILTLFLFLTPAAQAKTALSINSYGQPLPVDLQAIVDQTELPTPEALVSVQFAPCPERNKVAACLSSGGEIWIDQRYLNSTALPKILFHELGHLFDRRYLSTEDRRRWTKVLGLRSNQSWSGRPSEWFAELAASCWIPTAKSYSTYRYPFTPEESAPACPALKRLLAGQDWTAQPLIKAKWRLISLSRAPGNKTIRAGAWGGGRIDIKARGSVVSSNSCRGLIRYPGDRRLRFELCNQELRYSKSFSGPAALFYRALPTDRPQKRFTKNGVRVN